jgi:predicted deacylase
LNRDTVIIEFVPPDVTPYRRGNTGIDYVTTFESGLAGPEVVISAVMHGKEICGAAPLDALFRMAIRPRRGRLTLAFANVMAYHAFDPARPYSSRFLDEDMNRLWSPEILNAAGRGAERRRARALWPVFARADILLDLHSMAAGDEPLTLCGRTARGRDLAWQIGYPCWVVADDGHPGGRRLIDHPHFTDPVGTATALLAECGPHWRQRTVATAIETVIRLLWRAGTIDEADARPLLAPLRDVPRMVEVTDVIVATSDRFVFSGGFGPLDVVPQAGTVIAADGGTPIRTPYDDCVLILPTLRGIKGHVAVRLGRLA